MSDVDFGSSGKGGGGGFDLGGAISNLFGGGSDNSNAPTGFTPPSTVQPSIDQPSTSPFVVNSPIQSNSFDYLNAGTPDASTAAGATPAAGLVIADASLNTGPAPTLGSTPASGGDPFGAGSTALAGANSAGQPFAAGGTTAIGGGGAGASINPNAVADLGSGTGPTLAAPSSGQGAGSIAPAAPSAPGSLPADQTSSWTDLLKKGLTSNPLGAAISAGALGYNILQGQKTTANQAALGQAAQTAAGTGQQLSTAGQAQVTANQGNAAPLLAQGEALTQPLTTGQLPPQYTQQIDQAINDAKTAAISAAAKNGQPTDPSKNTALAQQLAKIDNQRAGMTTQVANTLFGAGSGLINTATQTGNSSAASLLSGGQNAAGLSGQLYSTLTGIDTQQSQATAKAIAALAQSLNSTGTNTTQKAA